MSNELERLEGRLSAISTTFTLCGCLSVGLGVGAFFVPPGFLLLIFCLVSLIALFGGLLACAAGILSVAIAIHQTSGGKASIELRPTTTARRRERAAREERGRIPPAPPAREPGTEPAPRPQR